jgi:ABC-type bacteriocin/lantibiotic exporter with double-glycine peptidase domain
MRISAASTMVRNNSLISYLASAVQEIRCGWKHVLFIGWSCLRRPKNNRVYSIGDDLALVRRILPYATPFAGLGFAGFLLLALGVPLGLLQPLLVKIILDTAVEGGPTGYIWQVAVALTILVVFGQICGCLATRLLFDFQQRTLLDLRLDLYRNTLALPLEYFTHTNTGTILSRLNRDAEHLSAILSSNTAHLLLSLGKLIFALVILLVLDYRLAVLMGALLPLHALILQSFQLLRREKSRECADHAEAVTNIHHEACTAITTIKMSSNEADELSKMRRAHTRLYRSRLDNETVYCLSSALGLAISGLAITVITVYGGFSVLSGTLSVGSLAAAVLYFSLLVGPMQLLLSLRLFFEPSFESLRRILGILDHPKEYVFAHSGLAGTHSTRRRSDEIALENVSFAFKDENGFILDNVSLTVGQGERVALVGPSGSGKSTLVKLIGGLYMPTRGRVHISGIPLSPETLNIIRARIAYVGQDCRLMNGTLKDNILYGARNRSDTAFREIVLKSGVDRFVQRMPRGYNTPVGTSGVRLSHGQRQRIAIARALLQDRNILILDEPTSSVDSLTEEELKHCLLQSLQWKTLIVVSHRPSTVRWAERVFRVSGGKVEEICVSEGLAGDLGRSATDITGTPRTRAQCRVS